MLHHHVDEFAARNLFLQLALASLSLGERLDGLLARHASVDGPRGAVLPGDAALIDATLGLIALRARTRALLEDAAAPAKATAQRPRPTRIPLR